MPPRYTAEFKEEAARQVLDNGYGIKETAERLGVHPQSLCKWVKQYKDPLIYAKEDSKQQEILKLKKELKRVTEERDILKRPPRTLQSTKAEVRVHSYLCFGISS